MPRGHVELPREQLAWSQTHRNQKASTGHVELTCEQLAWAAYELEATQRGAVVVVMVVVVVVVCRGDGGCGAVEACASPT